MGFLMPSGLPGEAAESISGYAWSYIGGLAKVFFRYRTYFFKLFLPFAIIYDSHHLKNCLERVSPNNPHQLFSAHINLGLRENSFSRVLWENLPRKQSFLRFLVSGFVFFHLTPSSQLLDTRCAETDFAKQRLASVDF